MTDRRGWLAPAFAVVALVTILRLVLLAFNRTDLFVDESQYWLWGQNLDFGYYSKPPLIAWVIRAVTDLAASDAPFWVRMPGAVLHGATALILGALAARIGGGRAGFWTALTYVTVPFAALGSLLISTDTIMAPAYAAALFFWFRLAGTRAAGDAILAGLAVGVACMAKYAGVYMLLGAGVTMLFLPAFRPGLRNVLLLLSAALVVILPNILWNLSHDLTTVSHTMDNVGWVKEAGPGGALHPGRALGFVAEQAGVVGPVIFLAFLWALARCLGRAAPAGVPGRRDLAALALIALPPLLIVTFQALMSRAYANWALAAYFAAIPLAVVALAALPRGGRILGVSLVVNGLIAVLLPLLTVTAPWPERGGKPLLSRYLGRAELSREIIETARAEGLGAVYAFDREILADLFYTGRDMGLSFYAPRPAGRPHNYSHILQVSR